MQNIAHCHECEVLFIKVRRDQRYCCAKCRVANVEKSRGHRNRADYQAKYYAKKKENKENATRLTGVKVVKVVARG